ncbi:type IV pilin protein [Candidatus Avelusimicrobium faecicola]|uniref:type IV pilin protein n=1 Tax=Candidatus Avelusimicrobium faecicola TaxID=3416205 RepID=UPI003D13DA41
MKNRNLQYFWRKKQGFTLIELLVVVLIIGVLAAMALPQYRVAVGMSRASTMYAFMRGVDQAQQAFYMANNRYATTFDSLSVGIPPGFTKTDERTIYKEHTRCYIMTEHGNAEISIKCSEGITGVVLEKYHNQNYYLCWAGTNKELNKQICRSLSGKDEASGISSDQTEWYKIN